MLEQGAISEPDLRSGERLLDRVRPRARSRHAASRPRELDAAALAVLSRFISTDLRELLDETQRTVKALREGRGRDDRRRGSSRRSSSSAPPDRERPVAETPTPPRWVRIPSQVSRDVRSKAKRSQARKAPESGPSRDPLLTDGAPGATFRSLAARRSRPTTEIVRVRRDFFGEELAGVSGVPGSKPST